jgi:hypothetical protein
MDRLLSIVCAGKAAASINANMHDRFLILVLMPDPGNAGNRNRRCMWRALLFQVKAFPLNSSKLEAKKRNEIVRQRTCGPPSQRFPGIGF